MLHSARFFKTSSMASHRWVVNIEAATPTLHHKRLLRRRGVRNEKENATHLNNNSNHSTGMKKNGKNTSLQNNDENVKIHPKSFHSFSAWGHLRDSSCRDRGGGNYEFMKRIRFTGNVFNACFGGFRLFSFCSVQPPSFVPSGPGCWCCVPN